MLTEQFLYLGGEATAGHLCEDRTDVFFGGNRLGRFCRSFGGLAAEHLRKGVSRIVNSDSRSSQVSDRGMVLTKNTYRNTVMKESQVAVMEEFVDNVKILINALGYKVLDPLLQIGTDAVAVDDEELFINTGNTSATGMVTSEGFVVLKGAVVNEKTSAKSLSAGMKKLRDKIFADGKVENMTTTEDILFSSSSAAAEFVLGYSASGPRTWKAKDGRTLKEIEDNATAD